MFIPGNLITGTSDVVVPPWAQFRIVTEKPTLVMDEEGNVLGRCDPELKGRNKSNEEMVISIKNTSQHWFVDLDVPRSSNPVDPEPFEIIAEEDRSMTLHEKVMAMAADLVAERYGENSPEYETLEDAMDLDMPEAKAPLSGYEYTPMTDVEPVQEDAAAITEPSNSAETVEGEAGSPPAE